MEPNGAKTGPNGARTGARTGASEARTGASGGTVGASGGTVGGAVVGQYPDPYHGGGTRYAPCPAPTTPGTTTPCTPPLLSAVLPYRVSARHSRVHQAS